MPKPPAKIVVFDLDETLGHFSQLGLVWDVIVNCCDHYKFQRPLFKDVMSTFPEYQRPGVIKMLRYLLGKKHMGYCNKVMIYTNNQGPREWAEQLRNYFEEVIGECVFDRIIAAFKINGKRIEPERTSHEKSVDDLISCTQITPDTQICFVDDQHHPRMEHENVYYIRIKPYVNTIPFQNIISRLQRSEYLNDLSSECMAKIASKLTRYSQIYPDDDVVKSTEEQEVDKLVSKRVLQHIQEFFKMHDRQLTRRRRIRGRKRTTRKSSGFG